MLILVMDAIDRGAAEVIVNEVSEVKGVIERKGEPGQPVGILDADHTPHTYNLLAGCDVRGDIVSSAFGELCIYKTQSDTHIEFSRAESGKIGVLESLYYQRKLEGTVVDGCCGAGTLGLVAVLAGAREVILNDAFRPAVKNTILNIKANASVLGLDPEPEIHTDPTKLPLIADTGTPRLVATAHGDGACGSDRPLRPLPGRCVHRRFDRSIRTGVEREGRDGCYDMMKHGKTAALPDPCSR
jgi:hypothetical protein